MYYSGTPQAAIGQPFVNNDSTALNTPGMVIFDDLGGKYVYFEAGATTITSGMLLASEPEDTGEQDIAVAATAIGSYTVLTTTTLTVAKDEYAGGFLVVSVTPSIGYRYRIASHPAASGAVVTFTLAEPLLVALTTASRVDVVPSPYFNVIPAPTSPTSSLVGVACGDITAGNYGWAQVEGFGTVINDAAGAITVGTTVMASTSVAGSVRASTGAVPSVATAMTGIAASQSGLVKLNIG